MKPFGRSRPHSGRPSLCHIEVVSVGRTQAIRRGAWHRNDRSMASARRQGCGASLAARSACPNRQSPMISPRSKAVAVTDQYRFVSTRLVHHARRFAQVYMVGQLLQHEVRYIGTRDCWDKGVSLDVFAAPIRPSTSPVRQSRGADDCPIRTTLLDESLFCFVISARRHA